MRACRSAIEFNSIPCMSDLVPGGRHNMKVAVKLGVPPEAGGVDLDAVRAVFPYGHDAPRRAAAPSQPAAAGHVSRLRSQGRREPRCAAETPRLRARASLLYAPLAVVQRSCVVWPPRRRRRKLLPIEVVPGGLTFQSGRVVKELGDTGDMAVIVVASVRVGY